MLTSSLLECRRSASKSAIAGAAELLCLECDKISLRNDLCQICPVVGFVVISVSTFKPDFGGSGLQWSRSSMSR